MKIYFLSWSHHMHASHEKLLKKIFGEQMLSTFTSLWTIPKSYRQPTNDTESFVGKVMKLGYSNPRTFQTLNMPRYAIHMTLDC